MPFVKGTVKGVIAVAAGFVAHESKRIPKLLLDGQFAELGQYSDFVIGAFLGLVVVDILSRDVALGRPFFGFVKGLSAAIGAAFPLIYLANFEPFVNLCISPIGRYIEEFVGVGLCYAYLEIVAGTFVGVLIADIFHAPFRRRSTK